MPQLVQVVLLSLMVGALYAAIASGLTLEFGVSRIINFAHGEFVMLGAYITYFVARGRGAEAPLFGMLVAAAAMVALSILVFRLFLSRILRSAEHSQLLATLGLSIAIQGLATLVWSPDLRTLNNSPLLPSLHIYGAVVPGNNLLVAIISVAMYVALLLFMRLSRVGLHMRFASDNPQLATFTGIDVQRMSELSFVIGGAMAGVAGGLVALILYISPLVGFDLVVYAFAIVALGGLGSIWGALGGSVIVALAIGVTSNYVPQGASYGTGVAFFLLVAALIIRPTGLLRLRSAAR